MKSQQQSSKRDNVSFLYETSNSLLRTFRASDVKSYVMGNTKMVIDKPKTVDLAILRKKTPNSKFKKSLKTLHRQRNPPIVHIQFN